MTEFEKGYEQGYKDGTAGAALPNVNDNGDKIDGYSYAYKTDSNGEPHIHIDSVRSMLKKAADVQPVVCCKDCKYRKERHYEESGEKPYIKYECKFTKYSMSDDGFCSFGAKMLEKPNLQLLKDAVELIKKAKEIKVDEARMDGDVE